LRKPDKKECFQPFLKTNEGDIGPFVCSANFLKNSGCMSKAPLAQEAVGKNPTDRGKKTEANAIFWLTERECRWPW
jgi:hypothetical protein